MHKLGQSNQTAHQGTLGAFDVHMHTQCDFLRNILLHPAGTIHCLFPQALMSPPCKGHHHTHATGCMDMASGSERIHARVAMFH